MSDKELNNLEISDEFLTSLHQAYSNVNEKSVDDCPMTELAIAYASGELQPDVGPDFRNHLHTCNYCLTLVLDFQVAERDSKANSHLSAKVLPGLSRAIKSSKSYPETDLTLKNLLGIISKFCSHLLTPKFIAVAAAACFVFTIINFGLNDPEVKEKLEEINKRVVPQAETTGKYEDVRKRIVPPENTQKQSPAPKSDFTSNQESNKEATQKNTNTSEPVKIYNPTGKTDPFEELYRNKTVVAKKRKRAKRVPRTPLEILDVSQLKLVGIILSENGNQALFEGATGKGYGVKKGTYIGTNGGKVIEITKDRVIIEEKFEDVFGKIKSRKIELKLQKKTILKK